MSEAVISEAVISEAVSRYQRVCPSLTMHISLMRYLGPARDAELVGLAWREVHRPVPLTMILMSVTDLQELRTTVVDVEFEINWPQTTNVACSFSRSHCPNLLRAAEEVALLVPLPP